MINSKEFKKLQKLSKLSFADDELDSFVTKLESVVGMINQLHDVDCTDVEPLRSVCDMEQRMRADTVSAYDISDDLFKNVPEQGEDLAKQVKCFVVPKVIE